MVVEAEASALETLADVETVYVGEPGVPHQLADVRWHQHRLLIRLLGCDDRDCAEAYRDRALSILRDEAAPLPPGTYYWNQILGLTVVAEDGEELGTIAEILETGANDVYVVKSATGEVLIPAAPGVVQKVDLEAQRLIVHLPEGLR